MSRWKPDAQGRLMSAAIELFDEQGYEATTVAEIAERAGLTKRTFFRYFTDKREVLFWGSGDLQEMFVNAVTAAPASHAPIDAVAAALDAVVANGGEIVQPIGADAPEITARFRDPGGNVVGLYQEPARQG